MLWDLKSFYHSKSIQEIKHVLRLNSRFLKFEARMILATFPNRKTFSHQNTSEIVV